MYFSIMLTRNNIFTLLLMMGFLFSAVQLYLTPNAVAWMASALAHIVVIISIRMERIPEFDTDFLGILNVTVGLVATIVGLGQWVISGESGPLAVLVAASSLLIWGIRDTNPQ
jgi:hypothetical protein